MKLSHAGLLVLKTCMDKPSERLHGYELMHLTGLASGTLYPILMRFEREGWLSSTWETVDPREEGRPRRRLYMITGSGQSVFLASLSSLGVGVTA
jgi:DNA-binding PadR family transcriptional regulator